MTPVLRKLLGLNWLLVLVMYLILLVGVMAIESAARHFERGGSWFADRQAIWILIGSVVYFATAFTNYRWVRWLAVPMYLVGLVLMMIVLKGDSEVHQMTIAGVSFQPAQLVIAAGIIMIAAMMQDLPKVHWIFGLPIVNLAVVALLSGIPFLLVVKSGDMGSALVWIPVAATALLVGGLPFRYMILIGLLAFGSLPIMYKFVLPEVSERGAARIDLFIDMLQGKEVDITDEGYAPHWVSTAVGKSGWKGLGWKAEKGSLHQKKFIPWKTAHNDFVFAVFAEEWGFRGSLIMVSAFGILLIQCLFIAFYSRDVSGRLMVTGVTALFFAHIFENIGMCVLMMPITGIPLPLVSYSGTFVVMCMFLLGLVQSVWVHRHEGREEEAA